MMLLLAERALAGALVLALAAFVFDQIFRRMWYQYLMGGKYHESDKPERKIRVSYWKQLTFKAKCTENGTAVWTSVFTYDRVARLGIGNYYYHNGANANDWGERRLYSRTSAFLAFRSR
jgi:hypothetical protein